VLATGWSLGGPFALEFGGFLLPTDRLVRAPTASGEAIEELGVADALVGGLDGRLRFTLTGPRTWHRLAPFVVAGGGVVGNLSGRIEEEADLPSEVRFDFGPSFLGLLEEEPACSSPTSSFSAWTPRFTSGS
jgi:hypothetical protein